MLLAIDAGNTHVKLGVFDGPTLVTTSRVATSRARTTAELGIVFDEFFATDRPNRSAIDGVILGSVVPTVTESVRAIVTQRLNARLLIADPATNCGMPIRYDPPTAVGVDRVANAIAAYERFGRTTGRPLIVCDLGTATKFEAVSGRGEYLGGAICPGIEIGADALFQRTARLPHVEIKRPAAAIGRSTIAAMQSGLFFGYVGLVEGLIERIKGELGGDATCVATGGLSGLIAPETRLFDHVDVNLTLDGLRLVWERNR